MRHSAALTIVILALVPLVQIDSRSVLIKFPQERGLSERQELQGLDSLNEKARQEVSR
ncbi:MAG: hypothetical protein ABI988_01735 [Nitrospirota bacterium]